MNDYILNFGTTVHCYEQKCGKLAKIAFDQNNWHVSDLIVEEGLLLKQSRAFPQTVLEHASKDEIKISVREDELRDYPEYRETIVETIPEVNVSEPALIQGSPYGLATNAPALPIVRDLVIEGIADHLDILDKETPLEAVDTNIGKVRGVAIAPENGLITHILIHKGAIFVEEFWLSTAIVDRISTKGVFINMTKDELDNLIVYDDEREHYWNKMPTDAELETADPDPVPYLDKEEKIMHDTIMTDETALAALIAEALMDDPRTEDAVLEVIHERGKVTLQGRVTDMDTKKAAEEIVCAHPGVVSVSNEVVVDPR